MKLSETTKSILLDCICYLYVVLFVYAAVSKLLDFENFQVQLGQSPLLSAFAGWVSWGVPIVELIIALLLVFPRFRLLGLYAAFSLMVMFTSYIIIILNFSPFVPCSCGGILENLKWREHLIFNILFVLFGVFAIFFYKYAEGETTTVSEKKYLRNRALAVCTIFSISTITLLFFLSEDIIHKRNNFIRRFPQRSAILKNELNLKTKNYYIAGAESGKIYLGNIKAPLTVTVIDTSFHIRQNHTIILPETDLTFRNLKITIKPPFFYVTDGTTPCIFRGLVADWKGFVWNAGTAYFTAFEPINASVVAIRAQSSATHESVLGTITLIDNPKVMLASNLLEKQIDGVFDTDGTLLYNSQLDKIIYTYSYRNQYVVADKDLKLQFRGNTIDTTSKAKIKVTYISSRKESKLSSPVRTVNRSTATFGSKLYINSGLIGKYEPEKIWKNSSIVDVYDIESKSYSHSFYVYDKMDEKMREFRVDNTLFIGLVGNYLEVYTLKKSIE
ncbi:DoxX family protein [Flavobacterium sp. GT3P67]|uniref:DoxX family protein n=1 Tax=Flavobacterium sp. GT3P67 TaxID=2541722 RepID=UPI001052DAAC|nr:MauE/DoxX family redox-associated membrane protein [Flavobacterium sp. GT3P67]TDE51271.1 hypothetical protein E0H99_11715 [Flavobacterium sp. GT3P67]